jgi:hypothetical protein
LGTSPDSANKPAGGIGEMMSDGGVPMMMGGEGREDRKLMPLKSKFFRGLFLTSDHFL